MWYPFDFCLFVCPFTSHSKFFHSYEDVTNTNEGLQILTYTWHSWLMNSEGSLACHTYFDISHPFIIVISEDLWHSHLLSSAWHRGCHCPFQQFRSVATGDRTRPIACEANAIPLSHPKSQVYILRQDHFFGLGRRTIER